MAEDHPDGEQPPRKEGNTRPPGTYADTYYSRLLSASGRYRQLEETGLIQEVYALKHDLDRLNQNGYRAVPETDIAEPGDYAVMDYDAAPGWAEWMYTILVYELPDKPLTSLGWR